EAEQRNRATVRLHPEVLKAEMSRLPVLPLPSVVDAEDDDDDWVVGDWLATAREKLSRDTLMGRVIDALFDDKKRLVTRVPVEAIGDAPEPQHSTVFVVTSKRPVRLMRRPGVSAEDDVDSEPGTSSFLGSPRAIPLLDHLRDVEKWAG